MYTDKDDAILELLHTSPETDDYLQPHHTNRASLLKHAVLNEDFAETQYEASTIKIDIYGRRSHYADEVNVLTLTLNETMHTLKKEIQLAFDAIGIPSSLNIASTLQENPEVLLDEHNLEFNLTKMKRVRSSDHICFNLDECTRPEDRISRDVSFYECRKSLIWKAYVVVWFYGLLDLISRLFGIEWS